MRTTLFVAVLLVSFSGLTGCKNPARDVPAATVGEPQAPSEAAAAAEGGEAEAIPEAAEEAAGPVVLRLTPENTTVEFTASKVTLSHEGGFTSLAGELHLADTITASKVEVVIDTPSVYTDTERLTGHLKSPDFFDVDNHPQARFTSTAIAEASDGAYTVTGNFDLHGVQREISFPAQITVTDANVSVESEFVINRQHWNITYPGMPDDLIRDEVVIRMKINADR